MRKRTLKQINADIANEALISSFAKLSPMQQIKNPIIFLVYIGAIVTAGIWLRDDVIFGQNLFGFNFMIFIWLLFTVLFANFAESLAEGRSKAQADALKAGRKSGSANLLQKDGSLLQVSSDVLRVGDTVIVSAGEMIPSDGEIIKGIASIDESAITGESAPVIRESGGDRNSVTGGTKVLTDEITVKITKNPGETFLDRMITLIEGAKRQKSPNEVALNILLIGLTVIFVMVTLALKPMAIYSGVDVSVVSLIALLVCLIPTTIGGLLSAIGIAGMDRLLKKNVLAMSGKAIESAGDVNVLLLDKTGTITYGNRMASEFIKVKSANQSELAYAALITSLSDDTPEGKSTVTFAKSFYGVEEPKNIESAEFIPFSAYTRMSGLNIDGDEYRKGAIDAIEKFVASKGGELSPEAKFICSTIGKKG